MRFIVLGDLHYANYRDPAIAAQRERVFEAFFRQVAAHDADLVFAIGDTTHRGTLEELSGQTALAKRCGLNLIRVTGNHDTDSLEKSELAPFFLGDYPPASADELYTSFDFGPARFVLLDTSRVKMSSINWSGFVSEAQLSWLTGQIEQFNAATAPQSLIVMGHHPLYATTDRSNEEWLNIANSEEVGPIFARLQRLPGLYVCGHNHSNSIFGPDELGWHHLQAGAPLVCQSFRLVTVTEQTIQVETVDFDLTNPALWDDFQSIRHNIETGFTVRPFESVYGTAPDLSRTINRY